ncbi:hypothetical protein OTK49_03040 [Vibrio coralliirubri]|uniref:hypothetical protein n=1 Tax=Vibrio coralliirubri TaxID=1516159 RepID=UPI002283AE1D|nr:hypothetical protein [Vibrio coralliirubri]MCY9861491.1 hypothetical protein [Vibrio coralliirubri]
MNLKTFTSLHVIAAASLVMITNFNLQALSFFVAMSVSLGVIKAIAKACSIGLTRRYHLQSDLEESFNIISIFARTVVSIGFMVIYETSPAIIKPVSVAPSIIIFVLIAQTALITVEILYNLTSSSRQGRPA